MSHRNLHAADSPVLTGEIARDLGVSRATAWVLCKCGDVPGAVFRGGRFEVDRAKYAKALPALRASRQQTRPAVA